MSMVDKVSSPDRVHPLPCNEIAPHIRMRVLGDGNCLFRAVSRHVTGTGGADPPREPRKRDCFFNARVREYLKNSKMAKLGVWGSDVEVFLLSSMLDVNIVVRQKFALGRTWQCIGPTVDGLHIIHNYCLCLYNTRTLDHYDCVIPVLE